MASSQFIRFFDKLGNDMNLGPTYSVYTSLYDGSTAESVSYTGKIYFPKVSLKLIESQHLFLLEQVTGPTASYELRRVQGEAVVVAGNAVVTGVGSDFSILQVGNDVKIGSDTFTVISAGGTGSIQVSPVPSVSITTQDIYYYDYLSYNQLRTSPGTFSEKIVVSVPDTQPQFFLYDVDYSEDIPYINRHTLSDFEMVNGSGDSVDSLTGRISIANPVPIPTQVNLGFSSGATVQYDEIYEQDVNLSISKQYVETLVASPIFSGVGNTTFVFGGTSHDLNNKTLFYLQGVTAAGATVTFYNQGLTAVGVTADASNTYLTVQTEDFPAIASYSDYRILWENNYHLATIGMYGETEEEDERFKLVLENFGKKVNYTDEYIFRESDIHEELPNYTILNNKRKELLLEGDNIYPFMGSYKALINIVNFFGYYDLRIKEYFLNVNSGSSNFGKYMHVLVPKNEEQRKLVKRVWQSLPSKIYKKTSLFGLFYDLNKTTDNEDIYGIPEVIDAFDYSPEEVLIKLFGLKELLKRDYLPLNARIYDITGEGIYFERIRIDSWSDNLNHLVLNLGKKPQFSIYPKGYTYVSDIRRVDQFYLNKFIEQGLTGFVGGTASQPFLTASTGSTGPISNIYNTYAESYNFFLEDPYNEVIDPVWLSFPPGISNPNFNFQAARLTPLPDDPDIVAGGPTLLEAFWNISWEDSDFTWGQLGILGPSGAPLNINIWTWESLGRGESIEVRWVVQKNGENGFFYDSGRRSIQEFLVLGEGEQNYAVRATLVPNMIYPYGPTGATAPAGWGPGPAQIGSVSITNPGFGYLTAPNVSVAIPGGTGTGATVTCTINANGYVDTVTVVDGGSGFNFTPFIFVDEPTPIYDVTYRYLHALALPYEGIYDVALYVYDITNNFSVDFQKYEVKKWNVDFVSISRVETPERTWKDFETAPPPQVPGQEIHPVNWEEATGPWYYPLHVRSTWREAETSWESLNFSSFDGTSLYEYNLNTEILEINREGSPYVILKGDLSGNLANLNVLNVGDYLFFERDSSEFVESNIQVLPNNFGSRLRGKIVNTPYLAGLSGATGSNTVTTLFYITANFALQLNPSSYISPGDQLWIKGNWYPVESVGATSVKLSTPLLSGVTGSNGLVYPSSGEIVVGITGSVSGMSTYSRVMVSSDLNYLAINPNSDFYGYVDGLTHSGNTVTLTGKEEDLKSMILRNSSLGSTSSLYLSWGIFSGTYAIEITNISLTGSNTLFRLKDDNKELYYLDGNFTVRLADYDVDYAETRIGPDSLTYQYADEITWNENDSITWFGMEYHGGSLCGFVIPFVSPGGSITVDENPTFVFSGDFTIDSTKSGLGVAAQELNSSLNSGIQKYNYSVLPEDELFINDTAGIPIDVSVNAAIGATQFTLSSVPGGGLKIPAEIAVTVTGGTVSAVSINNPGWGYNYPPEIVVDFPGGTGAQAILSCTLTGLPYQGRIGSVSIVNAGAGYTASPTVTVGTPDDYKPLDNYVWTGYEWVEVIAINSNVIDLGQPITMPVLSGDYLLLPYQYHKQLFGNPSIFQQFYFFIHGKAVNPSNEMLSYVNFDNGVESEWLAHPDRTYTYPLRNSFYFLSVPQYNDLRQDLLYQKWVFEGSDYPPLNLYPDYDSDILSYESRVPYAQTLQSPFSFIDTVVSSNQRKLKQFTPVVFTYDKCRIPGKKNPLWTIKNDTTGKIEVMSQETKFMWNFTKTGDYTVSLKLEDSNGNVSFGQKNSFIVI